VGAAAGRAVMASGPLSSASLLRHGIAAMISGNRTTELIAQGEWSRYQVTPGNWVSTRYPTAAQREHPMIVGHAHRVGRATRNGMNHSRYCAPSRGVKIMKASRMAIDTSIGSAFRHQYRHASVAA